MKKTIRKLLATGLVFAIVLGMTGCTSNQSQIKDSLSEFEYACKNLDVDAMLACIDPKVSDPIRLGMAIYSGVTGTDYEDLVDEIFGNIAAGDSGESFHSEDFLSTLSLSDIEVKVKKETAVVTCKMNFEISGEEFHRDTTIDMVKQEDKWYIAKLDMFS